MKKEVLKYLAGRFIPAVVSLAVIILAIRYIGTVEYGKYSLVFGLILLAVTLNYHWVQVSMLRFIGSMPKESKVVMGRFFDMTILSALASTLVILLIGHFYFRLSPLELAMVALFTFLNHFYLFHQAVFQALHCSIRSAILEGSDQMLILTVMLAGLFLFKMNSALLLWVSLVIGLGGVMVLRVFIRVRGLQTSDLKHFYWDSRFSGKVIEFGFGVALWLFFSQLLMTADRFIIMEYFGYHEAGMYSALKDLIYKSVTFSIFPIYTSYQTKIGDQWNAKHKLETWKTIKEAISFEILIFIILFIGFMVGKSGLFHELLRIPALDNWMIYLPVIVAAFLWQVVLLFQRFLDLALKSVFILYIMGITVVLNIVLNMVFIPRFGLVGSSVSLLVSSVFYVGFVFTRCILVGRKLKDS